MIESDDCELVGVTGVEGQACDVYGRVLVGLISINGCEIIGIIGAEVDVYGYYTRIHWC